jgi:hypothetical protein
VSFQLGHSGGAIWLEADNIVELAGPYTQVWESLHLILNDGESLLVETFTSGQDISVHGYSLTPSV